MDLLLHWRDQPEAQRHQPVQPLSQNQLLEFADTQSSDELATLANRDYIFIVENSDSGEAVGWMTVEILSRRHGLARIGYTVAKEYWGRGYATAAVKALTQRLFSETSIARIEADCSVENPASQRVLEKCGFHLVGIKHQYLVIHGRRTDHYYFEVLKNDWIGT